MRLSATFAFTVFVVLAAAGAPAAAASPATGPDLDLFQAVYARPAAAVSDGETGFTYLPGQGLLRWSFGEAARFSTPGADHVDSLRLSTASLEAGPANALLRPGAATTLGGPQAFELALVRNWPGAVSVRAGRLALDVTPHAGFGLASGGTQLAEAGALVRFGARLQRQVLAGSRVYLFAGARGRAIGLNLLNAQAVERRGAGRDGFVREAQAGVGFERGALTASVGYTHEEIALRTRADESNRDYFGLTLSIRPR